MIIQTFLKTFRNFTISYKFHQALYKFLPLKWNHFVQIHFFKFISIFNGILKTYQNSINFCKVFPFINIIQNFQYCIDHILPNLFLDIVQENFFNHHNFFNINKVLKYSIKLSI